MSTPKASPKGRLPEFASREEEAKFWDTHDFADFLDELTPVKARFAKNLSEAITIRFDPVTLKRLRTQASKMGIGPTTLVRMWILERLERENGGSKAETADGD